MSDNVTADPGTGGATFATDDDGTAHHPYTKIEWGADDTQNKVDDASGKRLPVKIGEELPAGTQNIGLVDVAASALPTGAATAAKQDTGNTALATLAGAVAGTEMQVDVLTMPSITVTGVATLAEQQTQTAALQILDNAAVVLGTATYTEATSTGFAIGAVRRDADTTLVNTTNEWGPLQMDANGRLKVEVFSGETLPVSLTSTTITSISAGNNNIGDVDVASIAAGDNNIGNVDIVTMPNVTLAAGTNTNEVVGDVADGVAAAGNPLGMGLIARTANRTAVSDGQAVRAAGDDMGRQVMVIGQVRDLVNHQHTQIASSSSETTIVTAGGAGVFNDLTQLVITNQTATAVNVTIKDSTAGTTRMIIALAASGGAVIPFHRPVKQSTAANNWTATLSSAAVTVNFFVQFEVNV